MGRYILADQIKAAFPQVVATAGTEPGDLEFHIETAEDEIDGRIGRFWNMATFSGNAPPIVKTLSRLGASFNYLRTLITLEDPSQSGWVTAMGERFESIISRLESGTLVMISGSGTIIAGTPLASDQVWSSTDVAGYKPTFDIRPMEEQHISRTRQRAAEDADIADSG